MGDCSKCNLIKRICIYAKSYFNICVFIFPLKPWDTVICRIIFMWRSKKLKISFHSEYCDFKNVLKLKKSHENHCKEYRQNFIISKETYWLPWSCFFYPVTPSLLSHTWGKKPPPTNKNSTQLQLVGWNIVAFCVAQHEHTHWATICTRYLFLTRPNLVLQQSSLQPQYSWRISSLSWYPF